MTNKVTKSDLEKLIEGVLSEKINVKMGGIDAFDVYSGLRKDRAPKDEKDQENWAKLGVPASQASRRNAYKTTAKLAGIKTKDDELTDEDLKQVVKNFVDKTNNDKKLTEEEEELIALVVRMRNKGNESVKNKINKMIAAEILGAIGGAAGDASREGKVKELEYKILSQIEKLEDQRVTPFAGQQMPLRSMETTEDDFKAGKMPKASPYLVDLFSGIEGTSISTKLKSIAEFAQAAEQEDLQSWSQGKNEFAPFIYAKALSYLAEEIKKTGSTEAGFQFERWIALLLNLPVAGAEQSAADNLGKIKGGIVYTSAKLYKNVYGDFSPSQSKEKLLNTTDGGTNSIYYFIGHKKMGGSEGGAEGKVQGFHFIDAIDLYMIEVFEESGTLKGRFVYPQGGGLEKSNSWDLVPKTKEGETDENQMVITPQIKAVEGNFEAYKFTTIPLPQGEITDNQLETTAEFLARSVNEIQDQPVTKAIMDAATSIKRMEANTDSYVGKSSKKKGSGSAYIAKITDDYVGLKDLYKQIFQYGGGDIPSSLNESKKITAKQLQKLIEEKFKK